MKKHGAFVGNFFESLPEGFLANALGRTSPRDVCTLSLVCSVFRSAAEWDTVWENFLPSDYQKLLASSEGSGGGGSSRPGSKKEMYLRLCDYPVIIDGGKKCFWLHKLTGKHCYMLAARDLWITWVYTPEYWRWIPDPESRFANVAELIRVCWLDVGGGVDTSFLSTDTQYAAYFVYKMTLHAYGFEAHPVEVSIRLSGVESEIESQVKTVFLDPDTQRHQLGGSPQDGPKLRQDGWLEIKLGEFYNKIGQEKKLDMWIKEVKNLNWKGGLIIQGIEVRPKES